MQKILVSIILLAFLCIAPLASPAPAWAQPPSRPCAINVTWASTAGTPDHVSFYNTPAGSATLLPLSRADYTDVIPDTPFVVNTFKSIIQQYETDWICTPSLVRMLWKRDNTNSASAALQISMDGSNWEYVTTGITNTSIAVSSPTSVTRLLTWTNPSSVSYKYIRMIVTSSIPRIMSMEIVAPDGFIDIEYVRPIKSTDESSLVNGVATTVVGKSNNGFAPVHSAINGVASISPLTISDCTNLGYSDCVVGSDTLSTVNTQKVTISGETSVTYLVHNANKYVIDGESVTAGCVLGETMVGTTVNGTVLLSNGDSNLLSYLTIEPSSSTPCNQIPTQNEGECLSEPFESDNWYRQGDVTGSDVFTLGVGGKVYQILALPQNVQSTMVVSSSAGTLLLRLGNTTSQQTSSNETTLYINWGLHTPNMIDFWEASVQNKGNASVQIYSICVQIEDPGEDSNGDGIGGNVEPSACYFANHSFSDGLEGWSTTSGVSVSDGQINVQNGAGLSQPVKLYSDGSKDYILEVDYELWYGATYTPDYDDDVNQVIISYAYPYDDNATSNTFVSFDSMSFGFLLDNSPVRQSITITLSDDVDSDMFIKFDIDSVSGVRGVVVNRLCLRPADGDWTGYDESNPTPFTEHCEVISAPQGNDIGKWVGWHWHNLSQFFQCDLMVTLNNTYGLLRWFQTLMFIFFQWLTNDLIMWMNGHVQNLIYAISNPQIQEDLYVLPTTVDVAIPDLPQGLAMAQNISTAQVEYESCNWYDVFCHGRNLLDTVGGVADAVGNAIATVVRFIGTLLMQIIDLILWGFKQFWNAVQTVYNNIQTVLQAVREFIDNVTSLITQIIELWNQADPLAPPGLDMCATNPHEKTICLIYWILENTIFSGTYGRLIVPLMVSVIGIVGFLIVSNRAMGLVMKVRNL